VLEASSLELLDRYDALEVRAIASEFEVGLRHLRRETGRPRLVAGLAVERRWLDEKQFFSLNVLAPSLAVSSAG